MSTGATDFEHLINSIPALIARMDCNLQLIYGNNQFFEWFHYEDHLSYPGLFNIVVGDSLFDQIQRHLGHVLVGQSARFITHYETAGQIRYLDISLTPQFDERRRVSSIIFHGSDVTERMNDQRALHDYFENATIGHHWVNNEGIIVWANRAELKMLGYEEHEYIGHHISKFHKSQDRIADILARLSKREVLKNYDAEMICKDGSPKFVSINSSVLWQGSKFIHTRCFTIDITAQKLAAEAVRESEQRFKIIAELVPLILWTSDENGMFTFLNSRWKELTGKEMPESIGNQWLNAIHPEDQSNIRDSWNKSLLHRSAFEAKFRILNGKGGHTVCYVNSIPRFDHNHNFIGYVGTMQDFSNQEHITASLERMVLERTNDLRIKNSELSKAERALKIQNTELEKINSELSAFAHVASHDLQEPLRKIQTFTDRVIRAEGQKLTETAAGYMQKIQNASSRMRALIHDILVYSKANNSRTEKEEVDLNDVVRDVILEFEVKIEEQNALIECIGVLPTVFVRRFQFHQLFLNLLSNALKFAKPGVRPHIRIISTVVPADEVRDLNGIEEYYKITMSDNGIGFDGQHAESIFEMFNRLHGRAEYEGTGIGLAICKKIVEGYGGKLLAEGVPGTGATFHMYLPQKRNQKNHFEYNTNPQPSPWK